MSTITEHIEAIRLFREDLKNPPAAMSKEFARLQYQTQCMTFVEAHLDELAALRDNARRYEWLRSNSDPGPTVVRTVTLDQQTEPVESRLCFGDDLDAKIDAEMSAAAKRTRVHEDRAW